ncbi:Protein arginine N-methyltransferase 5 [Coemansia erecta]|nr:Protein arginine N-methyltransferase 5 [Coemansia erecta]
MCYGCQTPSLPIRDATPLNVEAGDRISVSIWRRSSASRVWYEWAVETPTVASQVHNLNGREYSIGK